MAYGRASGADGKGVAQVVIGSEDIDAGKASQVIATVGIRHPARTLIEQARSPRA
jgi:hypothetical protein